MFMHLLTVETFCDGLLPKKFAELLDSFLVIILMYASSVLNSDLLIVTTNMIKTSQGYLMLIYGHDLIFTL